MKQRWLAATVVAFAVGLLSPLAWAQADDKPFGIEEEQALQAARLAQETAQKAALAEWLLGREEAASGRAFDPAFRAAVKADLTSSLSLAALAAQMQQSGLGPLNLGDSQADLVYTPVTPCRILDTRLAGGPIAAGATRDFLVTGDTTAQGGANCAIPNGPATAAVLNFVAVNPAGAGDLRVTPFGTAMPLASIVNYAAVPGLNIANGLVVTLCDPATTTCTQDITLQADVSGTDVVADVQGYFRKVRKEQVRSFVVNARSSATTTIGLTCTHYTNGEVTITAPVAGRVLVRADVILRVNHTTGTTDLLGLFIGTSATDCTSPVGYASLYEVPAANPTNASAPRSTHPVFAVFDVAAGTFTYYLNGIMSSGQDAGDVFWFAGLEATFFPN